MKPVLPLAEALAKLHPQPLTFDQGQLPHQVKGLFWAEECERPGFASGGANSVVKRQGLAYEHKVAAAVGKGRGSVWFRYQDASGFGHCQPDLILFAQTPAFPQPFIVVVECKLTWNLVARGQIQRLYKPVLEQIWGIEVRGVIVCKNVTPWTPRARICSTLSEAVGLTTPEEPSILHWPGRNAAALLPPVGIS